jgi:hypothetical protein
MGPTVVNSHYDGHRFAFGCPFVQQVVQVPAAREAGAIIEHVLPIEEVRHGITPLCVSEVTGWQVDGACAGAVKPRDRIGARMM